MNLQSLILKQLLVLFGDIDPCPFGLMYSLAVLISQPRTGRRIGVAVQSSGTARAWGQRLRRHDCRRRV